jgi:5-hydroxyisourate hydrolase
MASLSTHVLDMVHGRPAEGVVIELYEVTGASMRVLNTTKTDGDGRTGDSFSTIDLRIGVYELRFLAGDYFRKSGVQLPDPPFIDNVVIRFGVADPGGHYHVPLLLSAYGYSTYRGS